MAFHCRRFQRRIRNLPRNLLNQIPGSTRGSKQRRLFTYTMLFIITLMIVDMILSGHLLNIWVWPAVIGIVLSLLYFVVVVVGVIFLTDHQFTVNPVRLAGDALVSMTTCILAFALVYRFLGFSLDQTCNGPFGLRDSLYFSAVTFSTLGYGDFRPCADARIFAAAQAMIGNLHLGLIVGAAFLLASAGKSAGKSEADASKATDSTD